VKVVTFPAEAILIKEGNGLMRMTSPNVKSSKPENTKIVQGYLESSNVNVVEEMTRMIETLRMFEAYQRMIQSIDEADGQSVNNIARVA
jgi:flagellar basal-body rod protein FlgG